MALQACRYASKTLAGVDVANVSIAGNEQAHSRSSGRTEQQTFQIVKNIVTINHQCVYPDRKRRATIVLKAYLVLISYFCNRQSAELRHRFSYNCFFSKRYICCSHRRVSFLQAHGFSRQQVMSLM